MTPFIIGVAGGSGSGKSTVTMQIIKSTGKENVTVFIQDNYYKDLSHMTPKERDAVNFDDPNALDWELMNEQFNQLAKGNSIESPIYDFTTHTRKKERETITPAKIIVVEGLFALYDKKMTDQMQLKIFVDTDSDIRFMRRLKRDIEERGRTLDSVYTQYLKSVRPMYKKFIAPTKSCSHIIIPHGSNKAALEMIISRINAVIRREDLCISDETFNYG